MNVYLNKQSGECEAAQLAAALSRHPGLCRVEVMVDTLNGKPQYFAYVLSRELWNLDVDELRDCIAAKRPAEVLTSVQFVLLRSVLEVQVLTHDTCYPSTSRCNRVDINPTASGSAVQNVIASLCARVLKLPSIKFTDNFLDLGGQSLEALKVVDRIDQVLQVTIPVRILFESATVADIALAVLQTERRPGQTESIARTITRMFTAQAPPQT
jgi:hypothetical protein